MNRGIKNLSVKGDILFYGHGHGHGQFDYHGMLFGLHMLRKNCLK